MATVAMPDPSTVAPSSSLHAIQLPRPPLELLDCSNAARGPSFSFLHLSSTCG